MHVMKQLGIPHRPRSSRHRHRRARSLDGDPAGLPEVLAGVLALTASLLASAMGGGFAVTALSIRNLDESVKARLRSRAARHGRSMEAEVRAILTEAVREPAESAGLFTALLDRFTVLGGVDLQLPDRDEPARAADFLE